MRIAVFTARGFARFVTTKQHAAEVAGKVLPHSNILWRTAEKRSHPTFGEIWFAYYFKPKDEQVSAWDHRGRGQRIRANIAH